MAQQELVERLTGALSAANKGALAPQDAAYSDIELPSDSGRAARIGLWALAIGFGGFLLWAAFAPLDEGVPSPGMVSIDTKRKAVQHLSGGIVKEVLVREGDTVKEGQPLVRMDNSASVANYEGVRQRYLSNRATQARLLAEQGGAAKITLHPDLESAASDPLIRAQILNQEMLFSSRRAALRADLQSLEESMQGQEAMLQSYAGMLSSRRGQLALLNEELTNTAALVRDGYVPRNRELELRRMAADSTTAIVELEGNTLRGRRAIAELKQRSMSRQQEYRKEVEAMLSDITREVQSDVERVRALREDVARTEIKSPAEGQVVGLAVQTVGAVVSPGQKLMDVVPADEALLLEVRVAPHLIDRVHSALPVDVRFTTFAHAPQLVVDGKVVSISGDLLTEPQTNQSFYLARVQVTPEGVKKLGKHQLQPGMPVEVVFKTGERSLLTYLPHPLSKRIAASMKEE
jgi:membrane fusion protein, protease secretion system